MSEEKERQRTLLLQKRQQLSGEEVEEKGNVICEKLYTSYDWSKFYRVHIYLPITKNQEVNTWPFVRTIWAEQPNLQLSTSVYGSSRSFRHVIINSDTKFEEDSLGIPMPVSNFKQVDTRYDLIIVPVLGFDEKLNRLGYGRGVYDTFLSEQPQAQKIGLAYEISKLKSIRNETYDVSLDAVQTEAKLYN